MNPPSTIAYVALGSNLGQRRDNIQDAVRRLAGTGQIRVAGVSDTLEFPAVGGPSGSPPFLNAAVQLVTELSARELLDQLLDIERQMGRVRREKWGPRLIDLDLLLFGDQVIDEPGLIVPHPLLHERRFVLEPLAQIAPGARHPALNLTIAQLLQIIALPATGR